MSMDRKSDSKYRMTSGCSCGLHESPSAHERACTSVRDSAADDEKLFGRLVEQTVLRAIAPNPVQRRALLQGVGASTIAAAISSFFPIATATEAFAQTGEDGKAP